MIAIHANWQGGYLARQPKAYPRRPPLPRIYPEQGGGPKNGSASRREEHKGAHLDAFPWRRAGGQRILERGMERQTRPAVIGTIVDPDKQHLVGLHFREIIPAVGRVI